jgi:hypothetical protein
LSLERQPVYDFADGKTHVRATTMMGLTLTSFPTTQGFILMSCIPKMAA